MSANDFGQSGFDAQIVDDRLERFSDACGMTGVLRLIVRNFETGEQAKYDLHKPFAVIGSGPDCEIQLSHPDVSSKHVYIQILQGRVHCFDLGSQTGMRFRDGLRTQGILTRGDALVIEPFQIRLSQAAAYGMYATDDCRPDFENRPAHNGHLEVWNMRDQDPRSSEVQLRSRITLIGQSECCHIKLADHNVAPIQGSVVRTPTGDWIVNLNPDNAPRIGVENCRCELLSGDGTFDLGPIRMRISTGEHTGAERISGDASQPESGMQRSLQAQVDEPARVPSVPAGFQTPRALPPAHVNSGGVSDDVLVAAIERFGEMQQQILSQSHDRSMMLAQIIGSMRQKQRANVHDQIGRIRDAATELIESRRPRIEVQPGVIPDIEEPSGPPSTAD